MTSSGRCISIASTKLITLCRSEYRQPSQTDSVPQIVGETNSAGKPNLERCSETGFELLDSTRLPQQVGGSRGVRGGLDHKEVQLIHDETQIAELQALEATTLPSGLTRYAAPEGMHDDTVIANVVAFSALLQGPTFKTYD